MTAIAASSRCTATSCWRSTTTSSRRRSRTLKQARGCRYDTELDADDLAELVRAATRRSSQKAHRQAVPAGSAASSSGARSAPCSAPGRPRARSPTAGCNNIADDMGTAVNVQAMVFGNMGDDCATGVAFTRNPSTGEQRLLRRVPDQRPGRGRGRRHPHAAAADPRHGRRQRLGRRGDGGGAAGGVRASSRPCSSRLERHYRDMQDIEFTIAARQALHPADPHRQAHRRRRR